MCCMNNIYKILIIGCFVFISSIITACVTYKKNKIAFIASMVLAAGAFATTLLINSNDVPTPYIDRESDYSAIVLYTDEPMDIEYRISTSDKGSDEWITYKEPFKLEKSAIIYARAKTLWYTSVEVFKDVYVTENGLVYFSGAEKPGEAIVSITASYTYEDPVINKKSGNHYYGYEIKKDDIKVIGTDLNGEEKEISDFSYFPKILKSGKNTIEVEYSISDDISVKSYVYVNGDSPKMINLEAKYTEVDAYLDTILDNSYFTVTGIYEDGTKKEISGYSISPIKLIEGKNEVTISKDGLYDVLEISAIDRNTISENESEPNNDLEKANEIDCGIKYSGSLNSEEDVDYYKLYLIKKGRISIKFTHIKLDEEDIFWEISLFSKEENNIIEMDVSGKNAELASSTARVSSGVYYIKVSNYYYSDEKYTITVLFDEEDDSYENEPNDDLSKGATNISPNKKYTGNLSSEDDIDYYKFSIDKKRKVWIDFSHDKTSESDILWEISLFGDSEQSLLDFGSSGENAKITSDSLRLPAGNYYIRINDYYWSNIDYTLYIHSKNEESITENEDNGDYDSATEIALNSSVTGNLQSDNDIDFYKFQLKNKSNLKVVFTHNQIDDDSVFWIYELTSSDSSDALTNKEDISAVRISGNSTKKVLGEWLSLPKGTYYLKVYSYSYNNEDYKIKISN